MVLTEISHRAHGAEENFIKGKLKKDADILKGNVIKLEGVLCLKFTFQIVVLSKWNVNFEENSKNFKGKVKTFRQLSVNKLCLSSTFHDHNYSKGWKRNELAECCFAQINFTVSLTQASLLKDCYILNISELKAKRGMLEIILILIVISCMKSN